jgi:phosphatidylglycerol:prolipoprotein diacylglycerol transferase
MPVFAIPFPAIDALAYIAGLIGGWFYAKRLVEAPSLWGGRPIPSVADIDDLLVYAALGVILGGRLGYVMFYNPAFFLENPGEILAVWRGGMSFHGGLAGALAGMALLARRRGLPLLSLLDAVAPVAPIGLFFGRVANFINAELWGRVSDVPWAVVFPGAGPLPRHPSQLYEAATEGLILFAILAVAVRMGALRRPGLAAGLFAAGYAAARIFCEFFREPDAQIGFLFGGATMGMLLSLPLLVIGLWLIARARPLPQETRG